MWTQIFSIFQSFFSRGFWFGNFFPVVIFAALHLSIVSVEYSDSISSRTSFRNALDVATLAPIAFSCLVVLGYMLAPLTPLFRGWLDGSFLPSRLHDRLRREHGADARKARDKIATAIDIFNSWGQLNRTGIDDLARARSVGEALGKATDECAIAKAELSVATLKKAIDALKLPAIGSAEGARDDLTKALRRNAANLPKPHADGSRSQRLNTVHLTMIRLLADAATEARHEFTVLATRFANVAYDDPQATRVGDARMLAESYSLKVYGTDFLYLWPRLQLVLPDQGGLVDRIVAAQALMDFAILSLALVLTVPLVWLPLLAVTARSPWMLVVVGTLGPLFIGFFYELVVQTQISFGELTKTVIDRYRLDLLTKVLLQPMPTTRAAERELWHRLHTAEELGRLADLPYRRSTP